jgi:hypothetical protein
MGKDRLSQIQSPSGGRLSLSDLVSERYTCCPECGADLIELPYRHYSIIECVRGCGWWDEKHPVKKWDDVVIKGDASSNEDRLGAAIKWSLESQALRCDICGETRTTQTEGWIA